MIYLLFLLIQMINTSKFRFLFQLELIGIPLVTYVGVVKLYVTHFHKKSKCHGSHFLCGFGC